MSKRELTAEDRARVTAIVDQVMGAARVEIEELATLLATRSNAEFFGETEFLVRDGVHRIGARLYDAALEERKKRGTKVPA